MKLGQIFSGNYLKAEDLQGRAVKVTIEKVEVKEFDDGNKLVIHFVGKEKALVANKTNASIIQEVSGSDDTDNWPGTQITLIVKKVEFQGKLVPAIRVALEEAPQQPVQRQPAPALQRPVQPDPRQAPLVDDTDPPF